MSKKTTKRKFNFWLPELNKIHKKYVCVSDDIDELCASYSEEIADQVYGDNNHANFDRCTAGGLPMFSQYTGLRNHNPNGQTSGTVSWWK